MTYCLRLRARATRPLLDWGAGILVASEGRDRSSTGQLRGMFQLCVGVLTGRKLHIKACFAILPVEKCSLISLRLIGAAVVSNLNRLL